MSLRTLMAIVLAVGGTLGWTAHRARVQREAVEAIRRAGGSVRYAWEWRDGAPRPVSRPPGPKWLVEMLGPDYVSAPVAVWIGFEGDGANDELMAHVGRLERIEQLLLVNSSVTDAGLAVVRRLTRLKWFQLGPPGPAGPADVDTGRNCVTDQGLAHLTGMKDLSVLDLTGCDGITDAGMVHLAELERLQFLYLRGTGVAGEGVLHLKGLKDLRQIQLPDRVAEAKKARWRAAMPGTTLW